MRGLPMILAAREMDSKPRLVRPKIRVTGYVNGHCPTDVCGAVCCCASAALPPPVPPCLCLTQQKTCVLHEIGGPGYKPRGCAQFPQSQHAIDEVNRVAKKHGLKGRCQLKVEEL